MEILSLFINSFMIYRHAFSADVIRVKSLRHLDNHKKKTIFKKLELQYQVHLSKSFEYGTLIFKN